MLYYSEKTKQFYKTEEELLKAEAILEGEEQMNKDFKELLDACDNINKIRREAAEKIAKAELKYDDMKADFIELYGADNYDKLKEKEDDFLYSDKYYKKDDKVEEILTADTDGDKKLTIDPNSDFEKAFGFGEMVRDLFDYFSGGWKK